MSRGRDFEPPSFDAVTQSCGIEHDGWRQMETDGDSMMSTDLIAANDLIGDEATDLDAMLLVNEIDDSWLAETLLDENLDVYVDDPVEPSDLNAIHHEDSNVSALIDGNVKLELTGMCDLPLPQLVETGKGNKKMKSHKNNTWALRRVDSLRVALGWDMQIPFGDLPLTQVDELLANLFSRVVKIKGGDYPAESLMNMLGGYNRLLRRASDLRSLTDSKCIPLGKEFNIKVHPAFVRTRLTLDAAIKKTAKDGINKKRIKVNHITQIMEDAVLADVDHQAFHNQGCQKRLAFYLLVRCGIRGGEELWELQRLDLDCKVDKHGKEYVQYCERHSKNNQYTLERTKEEQF